MTSSQTNDNHDDTPRPPLEASAGVLSDVSLFLLHEPFVPTLIEFTTEDEREDYSHRIMQRMGIDVWEYAILNVHRIGIDAPVADVFAELSTWDAHSLWWPNHLSTVIRGELGLEHLHISLFGRRVASLGRSEDLGTSSGITLFELRALKIVGPEPGDHDSERYLLYECRGGYPVGVFAMYVRSPIPDRDEKERAQVFFAVSFDFYGKKGWPHFNPINKVWETIHNKATANMLNRLKQLCEWRFRRLSQGM